MNDPPVSHASSPDALLSVAGWTTDASTLRISKNGKTAKLEPRAMEVLMYLAGRPGETISREELGRGVIDAADYSMPSMGLDLGFYQVGKHYFPGWQEVIEEESARDPLFKRVYESYSAFREQYGIWRKLGYLQ